MKTMQEIYREAYNAAYPPEQRERDLAEQRERDDRETRLRNVIKWQREKRLRKLRLIK